MSSWRPARKRVLIDLTPLIDVVVTLLIVVLLAAEFQSLGAVDLNLPSGTATSTAVREPLVVEIDAGGTVFFRGARVSAAGPAVTAADPSLSASVLVRADRAVAYGTVLGVLTDLQGAGFSRVELAYEPGP